MRNKITNVLQNFAKLNNVIIGVCPMKSVKIRSSATFNSRKDVNSNMQSVIVVGVGYRKKLNFECDGQNRAKLAQIAVGIDYHLTVSAVLHRLMAELDYALRPYVQIENFAYDMQIQVDNGPIDEKDAAQKAGLGFVGKNGLVVSAKFGSFFNIGLITTSMELDNIGEVAEDGCGNCTLCTDICPASVLPDIDGALKCVSYITQKKGALSPEEESTIGLYIYGCDECQNMCPYNYDKFCGEITNIDEIFPLITDLQNMTKSDFARRFGESSLYWRGFETIKRNIEVVAKKMV